MSIRVGYGVTAFIQGSLGKGVDGIGQTTYEQYGSLNKVDYINLVPVAFGYDKFDLISKDCRGVTLPSFSKLIALSILTGADFACAANLHKLVDLFHSTDHRIPKIKNVPVVATIHDAIPLSDPQWVSIKYRIFISPVLRKSSHWADRVITVSDYSKTQIIQHFGIHDDRIVVIPNGVSERWFKKIQFKDTQKTINKYQLPDEYIVFVGTIQPRKNIERLISAYLSFRVRNGNNVGLVIIGRTGWGCDRILKKLESRDASANGIHWLNYVPNTDLEAIVKSASCLALPSLAEGFGLPVLEAFAAGVPVLTSNITSLPEVAGDAAILVNPLDEGAILEGLERILLDPATALFLRNAGKVRAQKYSWSMTADKLIDVYRSVV